MNYCIQLKNVSNLFQVGVREPFIVSDPKIKQISIYELRNQRIQWRELIKSPHPIYVSIDVDFLILQLFLELPIHYLMDRFTKKPYSV